MRLLAVDADDLKIVSAAVQDAIAQVGDIRFDAAAHSLDLLLNRFRWEHGDRKQGGERVRAALRLSSVLSVKAKNMRREPSGAVVSLMALTFESLEAPGGVITITFAGGGELKCAVECIDARLADMSDPWPTPNRPVHVLD